MGALRSVYTKYIYIYVVITMFPACVLCVSYPARWHGIALSTLLTVLQCSNTVSLCRGFVTTELLSLQDEEPARTLGVCGMSTGGEYRNNGLMRRTQHTHAHMNFKHELQRRSLIKIHCQNEAENHSLKGIPSLLPP